MLYHQIKLLQEENSKFSTTNPILNAFSPDKCQQIDIAAQNDQFVNSHRNSIMKRLKDYEVKNVAVGHSDILKQAFDKYNEVVTYLHLKKKGFLVERVPEEDNQTPDFKVSLEQETLYIEMKTFGFADGDLNYIEAVEGGLDAKISLIQQLEAGKDATAEVVVSPLNIRKKGAEYNKRYQTRFIECLIDKIKRIEDKPRKFRLEKTILLVDLCLLGLPYGWKMNSVPIYQEKLHKSMISGILWYSAFGKVGERVFSIINGEGSRNIEEGSLEKEGILNQYDWIPTLCFQTYEPNGEIKLVCFYREKDHDEIFSLIDKISDFVNDDFNAFGYQVLQDEYY